MAVKTVVLCDGPKCIRMETFEGGRTNSDVLETLTSDGWLVTNEYEGRILCPECRTDLEEEEDL